jgi:hypothetical protein
MNQALIKSGLGISRRDFVAEENHVPQDIVVELLIFRLTAVEEQEGVDKERQIVDQGDVERAIIVHLISRHPKIFIKKRCHGGHLKADQRMIGL